MSLFRTPESSISRNATVTMAATPSSHAVAGHASTDNRNPSPALPIMNFIPSFIPDIFKSFTQSLTDIISPRSRAREVQRPETEPLIRRPFIPGHFPSRSSTSAVSSGSLDNSISSPSRQKRSRLQFDDEVDSIRHSKKPKTHNSLLQRDQKKAHIKQIRIPRENRLHAQPRITITTHLPTPEPSRSPSPVLSVSPPASPTSIYLGTAHIRKQLEERQQRKQEALKRLVARAEKQRLEAAPKALPEAKQPEAITPVKKPEVKEVKKSEPKEQEKPPQPFIHSPSKETLSKIPNPAKLASEPLKTVTTINRNPVDYRDLIRVLAEEGHGDAWLNDNAVNAFYSALVIAANEKWTKHPSDAQSPAFHAFNSGWWSKMSDKNAGYAQVRNWAKRAKLPGPKILQAHALFFPCCLDTMGGGMGGHWVLAVAFPHAKQVRVYDSMHSARPKIQNAIRDYLAQEAGDAFVPDQWDFGPGTTSRQPNASDCGVFTCLNGLALLYTRDPRTLVPTHLRPNGRVMLAAVLVNEGFKGEFDLATLHSGLFAPYLTL